MLTYGHVLHRGRGGSVRLANEPGHEDHDRERKVHQRTGNEHKDPFQGVYVRQQHPVVFTLRPGRVLDTDKPTQRDGFQSILGAAPFERPDGAAEPNEELRDIQATPSGGNHVPRLVQTNTGEEYDNEGGYAQQP